MNLRSLRIFGIGLFVASCAICVAGQDAAGAKFSMSTPDRWQGAGWWPTKGTPSIREYVGPGACTKCHGEIAASQQNTPMFNAARRPSDLKHLQQRGQLSFSDDVYDYLLSPGPNETKMSVKDKTSAVSATVGWVFGADAQTYVLKQNDVFLESRLSYYPGLGGLDITPGHKSAAPASVAQALGDPVDHEIIRRCFGCHSTASTVSGNFDPEHAMLGVTCEACHGPGLQHVTAKETAPEQSAPGTMLNPARLSPVDSVDFCGACHRTPVDVALFMPRHMGISIYSAPALPPGTEPLLGCRAATLVLLAWLATIRISRWFTIRRPTMPSVCSATPRRRIHGRRTLSLRAKWPRRIAYPATCRNSRFPMSTRPLPTISSASCVPAQNFPTRFRRNPWHHSLLRDPAAGLGSGRVRTAMRKRIWLIAVLLCPLLPLAGQDIDANPSIQKRSLSTIADQINDESERAAFLELFARLLPRRCGPGPRRSWPASRSRLF